MQQKINNLLSTDFLTTRLYLPTCHKLLKNGPPLEEYQSGVDAEDFDVNCQGLHANIKFIYISLTIYRH